MKRFLLVLSLLTYSLILNAQITWDGGGDGISWDDANNWMPDGVPASTDDVLLDNSLVVTNYTVNLPSVASTTSISNLTITPDAGMIIQLTIPPTNTADPGLSVTGAGDALLLNNGAILMNATGAGSGGTGLAVVNTFRINNGGRYIHNNIRENAGIVSQLSTVAGTETGIFEYDVPGTSGYAVSLNARNYGTLIFSSVAAGAARTYTGNGTTDLTIRGDLVINANATLSSTMTANIIIAGNLTLAGNFDNSPPTSAMTGRSIWFNGAVNQIISGAGNFTFGPNFRNIEVRPGATVILQRGINLPNAANNFIVNNNGTLQMATNVIDGNGRFQILSGGWLGIGSPGGIAASGASGNVQTTFRSFAGGASYEYNSGTGITQVTGTGLPSTVSGALKINTLAGLGTTGVTLTTTMMVAGELILAEGKFTTGMPGSLFIGSSAITTAGYVDNSFVSGPMRKYGNAQYKFPVGKGVGIHPAEIVTTSGNTGDLYTVEYFNSNPVTVCPPGTVSGSIHHVSSLEYWTISCVPSGMPLPSNQVTLYATTYSDATDRDKLVIARCSGGTWLDLGNANTGNTGAVGDVTSLVALNGSISDIFTLASTDASPINPLPINLISFDAIKLNTSKALLNWELAACCSASAKFEIQRAGTSKNFIIVGIAGGSETDRFYNYTDNGLKNGINYYRLKMTDADGTVIYSRTVAVMNGTNGLLLTSLIPTIITHTATLTVASSATQKMDIIIIDMQGRVVKKQNYKVSEGNSNIQLSTENLPAGAYQLVGVAAEGKTNVMRFIKQ